MVKKFYVVPEAEIKLFWECDVVTASTDQSDPYVDDGYDLESI